jgi:hypothetical protein
MAKVAKARRGRQNGLNKSQAIRDVVAEMGGKPQPKEVIATLKQKGIAASPALVSNVISRGRLRQRGRKARRGISRPARSMPSDSFSISALLEAKKLVIQVGSVSDAKRALDALSRLL